MAKTYKYRVIQGHHAEAIEFRKNVRGEEEPITRIYYQGDAFESTCPNLVEKFGVDKFEKLPDNFVIGKESTVSNAPTKAGDYSDWTDEELKKYAAEEEIDISKAKDRTAVIKVIKAAEETVK